MITCMKRACVAYFDQSLGAAYSKRWSKYSFSTFFVLKSYKTEKIQLFWYMFRLMPKYYLFQETGQFFFIFFNKIRHRFAKGFRVQSQIWISKFVCNNFQEFETFSSFIPSEIVTRLVLYLWINLQQIDFGWLVGLE